VDYAANRFTKSGRVVIVGASLAGLYAAEALREEGFAGHLTLIASEPYEPYDRPPLSKSVLTGWLPAEHTALPHSPDLDAEWLLGVPAIALDVAGRWVKLADGRRVGFDRLLIATGTRANRRRPPRGRPPLHRRERRAAGRQLTSPTAGKEERSSHPARLARSGARQPARGTGLGDRNRRSRNRRATMVGAGGGREGELRADPWLEGRAGRERAQGRIARTVLGPFFSAL
jgi:NADPH-dependent 2,4-dienoyl-CoA reductase/sulfur reductase-like enzyme